MTLDELVTLTRARLHGRARREVPPGPLIRAAVLVPIIDRGEPWLLFAKRTERVGHHKGQISFPGGVVRPDDPSLLAAALRECEEEIGLAPQAVEALGTLDDTETVATQFVITPFVGLVGDPPAWRPDGEEIEKVIEVPLAADRGPVSYETLLASLTDGVARITLNRPEVRNALSRTMVAELEAALASSKPIRRPGSSCWRAPRPCVTCAS